MTGALMKATAIADGARWLKRAPVVADRSPPSPPQFVWRFSRERGEDQDTEWKSL
jgi:hypothetical protein